eukprot:2448213-Alexandrium_andersonii.AAC.1
MFASGTQPQRYQGAVPDAARVKSYGQPGAQVRDWQGHRYHRRQEAGRNQTFQDEIATGT